VVTTPDRLDQLQKIKPQDPLFLKQLWCRLASSTNYSFEKNWSNCRIADLSTSDLCVVFLIVFDRALFSLHITLLSYPYIAKD